MWYDRPMKWAKGFGTYRIGKLHIVDDTQKERRALCRDGVALSPENYPPKMLANADANQICGLCLKKAALNPEEVGSHTGEIRTKELSISELLAIIIEHSEYNDSEPINGSTASLKIVRNNTVKVKWIS